MYRIVGRRRNYGASCKGVTGGIPTIYCRNSNHWFVANETVLGGQFDWGGRLLKSNGGVQRFPQRDWKPRVECKGKRELDCEANEPSRDESRT